VGEIHKNFELKRFYLLGMNFLQASEEHLKHHLLELKDCSFYPGLVKHMKSGPMVVMI
jgi:nucleoside-diphosphate kinase